MDQAPPVQTAKIDVKEGGKISGYGETFNVNLATGLPDFSVPIHAPELRSAAPNLTLRYTGTRQNGLFGLGFDVALPSVRRMTDKGIPNYTDHDRIAVSGSQVVPKFTQTRGAWVKDTRIEGTYLVTTYRARTTGSQDRIEWWVSQDAQGSFWQVWGADNSVTVYGRDPACRIADPNDASRIFEWAVESVTDAKGNITKFTYHREDGYGLPTDSAHAVGPQLYPKSILYGNYVDATGDQAFAGEIAFDYGDFDLTQSHVTPSQPWSVRPDPFSTFRPGFELRTWRRVENIYTILHFDREMPPQTLMSAIALSYTPDAAHSILSSARQVGYRVDATGTYQSEPMPALQFGFGAFAPPHDDWGQLDFTAAGGAPSEIGLGTYRFVDLFGDGIAGVLCADASVLEYWPALGQGRYAPPVTPIVFPSDRDLSQGGAVLMDVDGNGQPDVVMRRPDRSGYYRNTPNDGWQPYVPFDQSPTILANADTEFADLSGDGRQDVFAPAALGRADYYGSLGEQGYAAPALCILPKAYPNQRPASDVVFTGFASMFGDGLPHRIRLSDSRAEVWPCLGYGVFGDPITIDNAPQFPNDLTAARIFVTDITGSGYDDLILASDHWIDVCINENGNRFSDPIRIAVPCGITDQDQVNWADVTGDGYASLVISKAGPQTQHHYLPFGQGQNIDLLETVSNNFGSITTLNYRSSTQYQLADKAKGRPWATSLSQVMRVLDRVTRFDMTTQLTSVTQYQYADGYYDPVEREFGGFGYVQVQDTQAFSSKDWHFPATGQDPSELASDVPVAPSVQSQWFQTGAAALVQRRSVPLPDYADIVVATPNDIDPDAFTQSSTTVRDAYRALRNREVAKAVFAVGDDGAKGQTPYMASGQNYVVKMLQPRIEDYPAVFQVTQKFARSVNYEQSLDDIKVEDQANLALDDFGNVTLAATINYPRLGTPQGAVPQQTETLATAVQSQFINHPESISEPFRYIGLQVSETALQLNIDASQEYFDFDTLNTAVTDALATQIAFGQNFTKGAAQSRPFSIQQKYFWNMGQTASLPLGQIAAHGLLHHDTTAVFPQSYVDQVFGPRMTAAMLQASGGDGAGYVLEHGMWWNPGTTRFYADASQFFVPVKVTDPFGAQTQFQYDAYAINMTQTTDPIGQVSIADYDYQTVEPKCITDPNGIQLQVAFSPLGRMVAFSRLGSLNGHNFGDRDLANYAYIPAPTIADVIQDPEKYLQGAGTYYHCDFLAQGAGHAPVNSIHVDATEYETPLDPAKSGTREYVMRVTYIDGATKVLAHQDRVEAEAVGSSTSSGFVWITREQVKYDQKSQVAYQYNPYVTGHAVFTPQPAAPYIKNTYDALGRKIRTDDQIGFFTKTEFGAWFRCDYDANDTIKDAPYYVAHISDMSPAFANERDALLKGAEFFDTPTTVQNDPMGRDVATQALNTYAVPPNVAPAPQVYTTASWLDIAGKSLCEVDPRFYNDGDPRLYNFQRLYDMSGAQISVTSLDRGKFSSGTAVFLQDATGKPLFSWSNAGTKQTRHYDTMRRLTGVTVTTDQGSFLAERLEYGDDPATNSCNQVVVSQSQGRVETFGPFNLQSMPLTTQFQYPVAYDSTLDWTVPTAVALLPDIWTQDTNTNRLSWVLDETNPDASTQSVTYYGNGWRKIVSATFYDGGGETQVISDTIYTANGDPCQIDWGNGTQSTNTYDPASQRLILSQTKRVGDGSVIAKNSPFYDAAGNVTRILQGDAPTQFYRNGATDPVNDYTYDAIYQLRQAKGRQQDALLPPPAMPRDFAGHWRQLTGQDAMQLLAYTQTYTYDQSGNLTQMRNQAQGAGGQGSWTRDMVVSDTSNHTVAADLISGSQIPDDFFDADGNNIQLVGVQEVTYTYQNKMHQAVTVARGAAPDDSEYYAYDRAGIRCRKVAEQQTAAGQRVEQTFYIGRTVLTRTETGATTSSVNVTSGDTTVLVANRSTATGAPDLIRYQVANTQSSVSVEVDENANILTYEEYYPYGGAALISGQTERDITTKRYRFAGKERDKSTGLYAIGQRYYDPWSGRWTTPDPTGAKDGLNLYAYVRGNPITFTDQTGTVRTQLLGRAGTVARRQATMNADMDRAIGHVNAAITLLEGSVVEEYSTAWSMLGYSGRIHEPDPLIQQYFGIRGHTQSDANNLIEVLNNFRKIRTYLTRPPVESIFSFRYVSSFFVSRPRFHVREPDPANAATIAYVQGAVPHYPDSMLLPQSLRARPLGYGTVAMATGVVAGATALMAGGMFMPLAAGAYVGILTGMLSNPGMNQLRRLTWGEGVNLYDDMHFGEADQDQRASTIVHEVSHHTVGTEDYAYRHEARFIRMSTPQRINNADSYGEFAREAFLN